MEMSDRSNILGARFGDSHCVCPTDGMTFTLFLPQLLAFVPQQFFK